MQYHSARIIAGQVSRGTDLAAVPASRGQLYRCSSNGRQRAILEGRRSTNVQYHVLGADSAPTVALQRDIKRQAVSSTRQLLYT